jgi:hypothetical protein
MRTIIVAVFSLVVALCAGSAFAAPTSTVPGVANTSQKGSVLVFPRITVQADGDTFIEISNDQNSPVNVECFYVNEEKGRDDFSFVISANGTVSWDVKTLAGDHVTPNIFPTGTPVPTPPGFAPEVATRGELICFAVNSTGQNQVAFNHLYGTATVLRLDDTTDDRQPRLAYKYNAWSFKAWTAGGALPADYTPIGTGGAIQLLGFSATTGFYDACPAFNNATFMPNGATLGNIATIQNTLIGVTCNQDLRQDFIPRWTKLDFEVWNSNEGDFTGSFICVNSVFAVFLGTSPIATPASVFSNPENFLVGTLGTPNARFAVQGIPSSQCPTLPTTAAGLLTVLDSYVTLPPFGGTDDFIGNTLYGAGAETGFILWDPERTVPPFQKKK